MTEKIWNQFKDELLAFIKSRVNDKDMSEDILQDIFIKIHTKSDSLSNKEKLSSWIYQITRNSIIDYYRTKNRHDLINQFEDNSPEDADTFNSELLCCLKPFIDDLPANYKHALLKTSYGTMSQKDYAKEFNITYSAAKSRVQRARKQLKNSFIQCCSTKSDKYGNVIEIDQSKCDCD
ncbi:MAG: RNA polymerase sigma factor SigZ [Carboxylicivirga sp.]|jgi:RNA polymerase sigma-70 factor (ECF subfamily)|nr:RNA polymerase sigma factor SigZ [Carboxylicivirga sp.]MCT4645996.1 RNA polymerase sigma factor SigZ [Carboxylicivirga sp.]